MAIEPGFQVRLGIYGIDGGVIARRAAIWSLLEPRLDAIIAGYLANVIRAAPAYRRRMEENRQAFTDASKLYTRRLLHHPFDEAWVRDAYDRAAAEMKTGLDMRARSAWSIAVLNDFSTCAFDRYRWTPRKAAALVNAATRLFMLDAANAVACHHSMQVRQAKLRTDELAQAIESFSSAVEGVRQAVGGAVASISSTSDRLGQLARAAAEQTGTAASAAADTAARIGSIAHASHKLSASIAGIEHQATGTVDTAQKAVAHSARTDANIRLLSQAIDKIGSVVSLISDIAAQTNLLALNATIEAARAGDAGKGFAVVASEVKSLAVQTAKATDDVGKQIAVIVEAMQRSMSETMLANQSIAEISQASNLLTETVVQQALATNEIAENANSASLNAATVTEALKTVQDTIRGTREATNLVLGFAGDLSTRTAEISEAMDRLFKNAAQSSTVKELVDLASSRRPA